MLDKIRLLAGRDGDKDRDRDVLAGVVDELKRLYSDKDEMIAQLEEMDVRSLFATLEVRATSLYRRQPLTASADG